MLECIWRSIKLQQFRLIPFITYTYSSTIVFVGIYVMVHYAIGVCEMYIFKNMNAGLLSLLAIDAGLFVLLMGVFYGMAHIYSCLQRGPIIYRKYLYITILSNVYSPLLAAFADVSHISKYLAFVAVPLYLSATHFLTYKNMPFLAIQEGKQLKANLVICLNNAALVLSVMAYMYFSDYAVKKLCK